ncbi:nucleoid-associated protein [Photobacterium phosphoreum]|uniref:nucleoid-associated protein n=1 Tax=Photobacterium phosphoreum TaxID=659 RepID=UPI001E28327F|nr:nucleoid-associated protein [Photobacterium phosphoreum]MCD9518897.1 hypothetical protein [Photobacterium phosphoreum]
MSTNTSPVQLVSNIPSPIKKVFVYDIDIALATPTYSQTNTQALKGLNDFLIKLTQDTVADPNHKIFSFEANSFSKSILEKFLISTDPKQDLQLSLSLAEKLLQAEKDTSGKVKHLNNGLRKGSMVVCHFSSSNRECLIVSKLDFESFLEKGTYSKKQGLPEKKGVLKSCLINVDTGKLESDVYLLDSNGVISSFWSKLFLETIPLMSDSQNTKRAYSRILSTFKGLSISSKVDYQHLKNNLIGYFSTNTNFSITALLDSLIGSYNPVSDKVNLDEIKDKISQLVKDKMFDGTFEIDDSEIKKQFKQVLKLDGEVTVTTKKSYNDRIYKKTINGESYMLIRTNTGLEEVQEHPSVRNDSSSS